MNELLPVATLPNGLSRDGLHDEHYDHLTTEYVEPHWRRLEANLFTLGSGLITLGSGQTSPGQLTPLVANVLDVSGLHSLFT